MRKLDTDILIIGAGGAGLRAALSAYEKNPDLKITVISRGKAGHHGTTATACSDRMAFHASLPSTESETDAGAWVDHARDIYEGGGFVSDPKLADILAKNSADAFNRLQVLGVPFARDEKNRPLQFVTDGSKFARACYTGPYTARDIQRALLSAAKKTKIELIDNLFLASILKTENGAVAGGLCVSEADDDWVIIHSKAVIIATGGPGGLFESNVFPERMDPSPWFAAIRAGATLVNLEFIQFGLSSVKTSLACSGSLMHAIPNLIADDSDLLYEVKELAPGRNPIELMFNKGSSWPISSESESRAIDIAVWNASCENKSVYLDFRSNSEMLNDPDNLPELVKHWYSERAIELIRDGRVISPYERLKAINPDVIDWFRDRGVDLEHEPLEICHAAQHFQGGILIDTQARTGVHGLYACGEAAGGQHGANRPGGNSLLDTQVMGHIAGTEAALYAEKIPKTGIPKSVDDEIAALDSMFSCPDGLEPSEIIKIVRRNLSMNLSLKRSSDRLNDSEEILGNLFTRGVKKDGSTRVEHLINNGGSSRVEYLTAISSMVIGLGLTRSAKGRAESRGPHFYFVNESDLEPAPRNDPSGRFWSAIQWDRVYLIVTKKEIPAL